MDNEVDRNAMVAVLTKIAAEVVRANRDRERLESLLDSGITSDKFMRLASELVAGAADAFDAVGDYVRGHQNIVSFMDERDEIIGIDSAADDVPELTFATIFGINRSNDPTRLAGVDVSDSYSPAEAIQEAVEVVCAQAYEPFHTPLAPPPAPMSTPQRAPKEPASPASTPSTESHKPTVCSRCNMQNDYAEPNQPDGSYICFGCRT